MFKLDCLDASLLSWAPGLIFTILIGEHYAYIENSLVSVILPKLFAGFALSAECALLERLAKNSRE